MAETAAALTQAMIEAAQFLERQQWKFCLIGGIAAGHWGRSRNTEDVDFVLLAGFGDERTFIKPLVKSFRGRLPDTDSFAIENRVVLLKASNGVAIDISLGALPFEEEMLNRAVKAEVLPGVFVPMATAEDLVVMKAIAWRPRDIDDIERIIAAQDRKLDLIYIRRWLAELSAIDPEFDVSDRFEQLLLSVNQRMQAAPKPSKASNKKSSKRQPQKRTE